ncbi:hypothetical protein J1614_003960 [Plenodomus biglobosus]|nr:hypothetical protein J1614_003960 [Plenodomus biglobosus]
MSKTGQHVCYNPAVTREAVRCSFCCRLSALVFTHSRQHFASLCANPDSHRDLQHCALCVQTLSEAQTQYE